jgi:hypothetical protein
MNTATAESAVINPIDRVRLDEIARELEDTTLPPERIIEMIAEVTTIASRYECDCRMAED